MLEDKTTENRDATTVAIAVWRWWLERWVGKRSGLVGLVCNKKAKLGLCDGRVVWGSVVNVGR